MVHYKPSETAAAALCLSQLVLDGQKWVILFFFPSLPYTHTHLYTFMDYFLFPLLLQSPTQQHYSTYAEAHLKPIMQQIAKNVVTVNEGLSKHVVSAFLLDVTRMLLPDFDSKQIFQKGT